MIFHIYGCSNISWTDHHLILMNHSNIFIWWFSIKIMKNMTFVKSCVYGFTFFNTRNRQVLFTNGCSNCSAWAQLGNLSCRVPWMPLCFILIVGPYTDLTIALAFSPFEVLKQLHGKGYCILLYHYFIGNFHSGLQ